MPLVGSGVRRPDMKQTRGSSFGRKRSTLPMSMVSASRSSESRACPCPDGTSYSTVQDQSVPVTATDGRNQLDCIAPAIIVISKSEASTELNDACMSNTEIDSGRWRAEKWKRRSQRRPK